MYKRFYFNTLKSRINEPRKFIQVITGPRQVGKTTLVQQYLGSVDVPAIYETADAVISNHELWISNVWDRARIKLREIVSGEIILCLDEVQKIPNWSEFVKLEWDRDTREQLNIKVILLGSSRLLLMEGLSESLAGRFESIIMPHWKYSEMNQAFGVSPEEYVWFGGYPGASDLRKDENRWKNYVRDALIETAISKDVFMTSRISKPALLKRFFELSAHYSGQIVSYTKLLGQLQDAGNTVTLAHYLDLIDTAGLINGLDKYSSQKLRQRASSPKFQVYNPAISSCYSTQSFQHTREQPGLWGRYVESAIGAHLLTCAFEGVYQVFYWRDKHMEVDFVLKKEDRVIAIEVKSGRKKSTRGLEGFARLFKPYRTYVIGSNAFPWEEFIALDPVVLFD